MLDRLHIGKPGWVERATSSLEKRRAIEQERVQKYQTLSTHPGISQIAFDRWRRYESESKSAAAWCKRTLDVIHVFWR